MKRPKPEKIIARARELYASENLEIDDKPEVSQADKGAWVSAWVWVSNSETREQKS